MRNSYRRTVEELREKASMFWPSELSAREAKLSIIPELVKTQDKFIATLSIPLQNPCDLLDILEKLDPSELPPGVFLKHLVVLADFGGEKLQRLNSEFEYLFPSKEMVYIWKGKKYSYNFKKLPVEGQLNNDKLGISAKKLLAENQLRDVHRDVIAVLLFGAVAPRVTVVEG